MFRCHCMIILGGVLLSDRGMSLLIACNNSMVRSRTVLFAFCRGIHRGKNSNDKQ